MCAHYNRDNKLVLHRTVHYFDFLCWQLCLYVCTVQVYDGTSKQTKQYWVFTLKQVLLPDDVLKMISGTLQMCHNVEQLSN